MTKFQDVPCHTFAFGPDMTVVCPRCNKAGAVRLDREHHRALFQCEFCHMKKEVAPEGDLTLEVTAQCTSTGKYFRQTVPGDKIHGPKVRVRCPYCQELVIGAVSDKKKPPCVVFQDIRQAEDPYFHYPLYFQTNYRGKIIWALNRAHLQYLIDYLSADRRLPPAGFHKACQMRDSLYSQLPTFMKTAKNRGGIVRRLTRLQMK